MQARDIWCVLGQQIAVLGPQNSAPDTFTFYSDDDYLLRLNAQTVAADGSISRFLPSTFPFVSFQAGIGLVDSTPLSGTFTLTVVFNGGDPATTGDLAFNIAPADLQTALNALAPISANGGVVVTEGNTPNVWIIRPVVAANVFTFTVGTLNLVPLCFDEIKQGSDTDSTFTFVKLFKAPYAYTDSFTFPEPPPVELTMGRVGSSNANCIQYLTIPVGAMGQFDLTVGGAATNLLAVDCAASDVSTALNALYSDGVTNPRFQVSAATDSAGDTIFQITCVGPLSNQAVALLGSDMYSQAPLSTPEALWNLGPVPVELAVAGLPSVPMILEIIGIDADGNESTLVHQPCTVINRMLSPAVITDIAAVATKTVTVYVSTSGSGPDATVIGQRSQPVDIPGSGTAATNGTYTAILAHNLNTLTPIVTGFEMIQVSPAEWRQMDETEFDARTLGDPNSVSITMAYEPPAPGNVGAVKFWVTNPSAQAWLQAQTWPLTSVYRASDNVTLDVILANIVAALPSGWPSVPASTISGAIEPNQIDLTALAQSFATNSAFLTTLQTLISNATIITNIANALTTNTSFATTLITLLGPGGNTDILNALTQSLFTTNTFTTDLQQIVASIIGSAGASLPNQITIVLTDITWTYPPLNSDGSFASLPSAAVGSTASGDVSLNIPDAAANAGNTLTVVGVAYLRPNRRLTFYDGQVIYSTGVDWYLALMDGTTAYAQAFEQTLFTIYLDDGMLIENSQFNLNLQFGLSIAGNCNGYYVFQLRIGTPQSAGGSANLTDIDWADTIITDDIVVTNAQVIHAFGYTVARAADSGGSPVLTATKTEELLTGSATAPAAPTFVVQGILTHFDTDDIPRAAGQVKLTMKGQMASIVKTGS